ncbi:hypothetical protein JOD57_003792 [Geodermatophilus bullaregiensis]|uniref:Rv0361 family membrane protein n=1 Tax=Geodermatophilus bullaregiensis TaxID=1564160 RepID=UPI001955F871|nr:hypothetical protein [Geodermatophilus bullaregiensis]MBM7807955.1 hypothetical protein [Geodermatophilus bullaregiensis]
MTTPPSLPSPPPQGPAGWVPPAGPPAAPYAAPHAAGPAGWGPPVPPATPPSWLAGVPAGPSPVPGPAGPARNRRLVAGAAVLAVGVLVTTVVLADSGGSTTPGEVAVGYVDALQSGDYTTAYQSLCREERDDYDDADEFAEDMDHYLGGLLSAPGRVVEVEQDGEGWEVDVRISTVFGTDETPLDVVVEDGELRVCDDLADSL